MLIVLSRSCCAEQDPTGSRAGTWALASFIPGEAAVKPDCHGPSLLIWCGNESLVLSCRGEPTAYLTVTEDDSMVPAASCQGVNSDPSHQNPPSVSEGLASQEDKGVVALQTPTKSSLLVNERWDERGQSTGERAPSSVDIRRGSRGEGREAEVHMAAGRTGTATVCEEGGRRVGDLLPEFASLPFLPVPEFASLPFIPVPPQGGGNPFAVGRVPLGVGPTPRSEEVSPGGGSSEEAIAGLAVWDSGGCNVVLVLHQDGLLRAFPHCP
jgi:hypothetical protein